MSKPSIDEQIKAVEAATEACRQGNLAHPHHFEALEAAFKTLIWVQRHAPTMKTVLSEFPGSRVAVREEK